jgi:hypothetical protein
LIGLSVVDLSFTGDGVLAVSSEHESKILSSFLSVLLPKPTNLIDFLLVDASRMKASLSNA